MLATAGFHWAFIDTEHGVFDIETVRDICRESWFSGLCPIVRVADMQYALVGRALDNGAMGIIFPRVESPELLATAVKWTKFPPIGVRGYGLTPLHCDFAKMSIAEVAAHWNENILTILQIETVKALDARDELLSVGGIDAVMVGPVDLSISLGVPGDFQHPKMVDAMEKIRDSCLKHGVAPGTQTRTPALAQFWKERGMKFLGCSSEFGMMYDKAVEIAKNLTA